MGTLLEELGIKAERALGLSEDEVKLVADDQRVDRLPRRYIEFLRLMGRRADRLLRGSDAFYPTILGLKGDAEELLAEAGYSDLLSADSVVFAMHQGYQIYWMESSRLEDPPVRMYQEGTDGVCKSWESFTAFLLYEAARL